MDSGEKDWNDRDNKMVQNIQKFLMKYPKGQSVVVLGKRHARTRTFHFHGKPLTPVRHLLKNQAVGVNIRYVSGHINNFGVRKITDKPAAKYLRQGAQYCLIKSRSIYFDYDFIVRRTRLGELLPCASC